MICCCDFDIIRIAVAPLQYLSPHYSMVVEKAVLSPLLTNTELSTNEKRDEKRNKR